MTVQTVTEQDPEPDIGNDNGVAIISASQLRLGDVVDYPHGPAQIVGLWSPGYLVHALGPGSVSIKHTGRAARALAGDQDVQVLLPRPAVA